MQRGREPVTWRHKYPACPARCRRPAHRHGGGEVHERGHAAEDALRVIDEADQLALVGAAAQVDHAVEPRVVMPFLADLDELDAAAKMIDHLLVALWVPPLDGVIKFAAGGDPEREVAPGQFLHLRALRFFQAGEVDVAPKSGGPGFQAEPVVEKFVEAVDAVVGGLVAEVDERVMTGDRLDLRIILGKAGEVGIVFPELRTARLDIGEKFSRTAKMQVAHRRREHDEVARGQEIFQDQFLFHARCSRPA